MWLYPTIFVCVLLCIVGLWLTIRGGQHIEESGQERDADIPEPIIGQPLLLNPIILSYIIFGLFTGTIIFYYWAKAW